MSQQQHQHRNPVIQYVHVFQYIRHKIRIQLDECSLHAHTIHNFFHFHLNFLLLASVLIVFVILLACLFTYYKKSEEYQKQNRTLLEHYSL